MIGLQFKELTVGDVVYSYRKQFGLIIATRFSGERFVDASFVSEAVLGWRSVVGRPLDQRIYGQTFYQLRRLLLNYTVGLGQDVSMRLLLWLSTSWNLIIRWGDELLFRIMVRFRVSALGD